MKSIELVKSIYTTAEKNGKLAWLSEKQEMFLFSLLSSEGRLNSNAKRHHIATILPDGSWVEDITLGESIAMGEENIKRVYIISPPFYIKRERFNAKRIIIL